MGNGSEQDILQTAGLQPRGTIDRLSASLGPVFRAFDADGRECVAAVESAPPTGIGGVEAALARGYLRAADCAKQLRLRPVVVVKARSVTERTARQVDQFARAALGAAASFVLMDGRTSWHSNNGGQVREVPLPYGTSDPASHGSDSRSRRTDPLLTDGMLVCLKAAFAPIVGREHSGLPNTIAALPHSVATRRVAARFAVSAGVSESHAYRFLANYRDRRFLSVENGLPVPRRRRELLELWSEPFRLAFRTATRASTREVELVDWVRTTRVSASRGARAAIGAHHAAESHGVHATVGAPLTIHIEDRPVEFALATRLELNPVGGANILLINTRFSRGVFDATLAPESPGALPIVDLVQSYLDALVHPHRGKELAAALAARFPDLISDEEEG